MICTSLGEGRSLERKVPRLWVGGRVLTYGVQPAAARYYLIPCYLLLHTTTAAGGRESETACFGVSFGMFHCGSFVESAVLAG
jgi:hypothetical protein